MISSAVVERAQFSSRLKSCLRAIGINDRYSAVAKGFNQRSLESPVTVHAVRKWLLGEAIPTQEKIVVIAKWLGVTPYWLRYGVPGDTAPSTFPTTIRAALESDIAILTEDECKVMRTLVEALLNVRT